jgi:hypothetical protein
MHWLLIGAASISVAVGFCTALLRLVIDLLRVVDEKSQARASNDGSYTLANQLPGGSATKRGYPN